MTLNRYTALEHSESSMSATRLMPSDGPFLGRFDGTMIHRGYAGIGVFYIRWHSNPHRSEVIAGDPPDQPCFRRVVAHELGNLLGMLDHDRNPNCVMYDDPNMNDHQRVNDPQPTEYADDNPPSELLWGI